MLFSSTLDYLYGVESSFIRLFIRPFGQNSFEISFDTLSLNPQNKSLVKVVKKQSTSTIVYVCSDNAPVNNKYNTQHQWVTQ